MRIQEMNSKSKGEEGERIKCSDNDWCDKRTTSDSKSIIKYINDYTIDCFGCVSWIRKEIEKNCPNEVLNVYLPLFIFVFFNRSLSLISILHLIIYFSGLLLFGIRYSVVGLLEHIRFNSKQKKDRLRNQKPIRKTMVLCCLRWKFTAKIRTSVLSYTQLTKAVIILWCR